MLIVLMDLSRDWGSTQIHLVDLALLLRAEDRLKVLICCPAHSPLAQKIKAHDLPLLALYPPYVDRWWNPLHLLRLWLRTRQHRHCIFHTFSDLAARLALSVARRRPPNRTAIIHNCHNVHSLATRDAQGEMPPWWKQLTTVLCGNNFARKQLLDAGLDPMRVVRMPAGVDISALHPRVGLPEKRCCILSMTSRADSACHSVLLKAMAALWQSERLPPWEVRIIGQCDNFQQIMSEANALGVQSRLALLQAQSLPEVLPLGHIMVSPGTSVHGSLPVMAAAWATGLPLLCPDLAANREWAKPDANAVLYKAEDPQDLAACLKKLIRDTALYHTLADGGKRMLPLVSQEAALAQIREIYTQCIHKHGWVLAPKAAATAAEADAPLPTVASPKADPANAASDQASSPKTCGDKPSDSGASSFAATPVEAQTAAGSAPIVSASEAEAPMPPKPDAETPAP